MWLTDGRRSLLLQGERIARVEAGKRGLFVEALTPGLQDAHAHPLYWGVALRGLDLSGLKDPEAVAREVLWAHTLGASLAAGWADYGRIAPGARADLTLWEGKRPVGRVYRGNLEIF